MSRWRTASIDSIISEYYFGENPYWWGAFCVENCKSGWNKNCYMARCRAAKNKKRILKRIKRHENVKKIKRKRESA